MDSTIREFNQPHIEHSIFILLSAISQLQMKDSFWSEIRWIHGCEGPTKFWGSQKLYGKSKEHYKQNRNRLIDTETWLMVVRSVGGMGKKGEETEKYRLVVTKLLMGM